MSIMRRGANSNSINGVQFKVIQGVTGSGGGDTTFVAHGLDIADIVGWISTVAALNGVQKFAQGNTATAGFRFQAFPNANDMILQIAQFSSENIRSSPFEILIWYRN